ncbi:MAG: NUDIX hydrolase [Acidimicrobiia bacterium]
MAVTRRDELVRAAGGVVWQRGRNGKGAARILLVHRPRYDDWSLPKGKAEVGERAEDTALREVQEETGLQCRLGPEVGRTRYRDSRGRPKEVRYWLMEPLTHEDFEPNDEVDEVVWCSPGEAKALLTYDHDQRLVASVGEELE